MLERAGLRRGADGGDRRVETCVLGGCAVRSEGAASAILCVQLIYDLAKNPRRARRATY